MTTTPRHDASPASPQNPNNGAGDVANATVAPSTPTQALTATTSTPDAGTPMSSGPLASVLGSALALAFVLALAWLFLKLLHRASTLRSGQTTSPLQIVQHLSLGGRERVLVVRSGDQEYLLGVTPSQVQLLDKRPHQSTSASPTDS